MGRKLTIKFVGHNAFLRWKAVQSVAYEEDGMTKFWSDGNILDPISILHY